MTMDLPNEASGGMPVAPKKVSSKFRLAEDILAQTASKKFKRIVQQVRDDALSDRATKLSEAEEFGKLIDVCEVLQMPLHKFPGADAYKNEVLARLDSYVDIISSNRAVQQEGKAVRGSVLTCDDDSTSQDLDRDASMQPTPQAQLLANFMLVPSIAAKEIMEGIVEPMVVFEPRKDGNECRPPSSIVSRFPYSLAPFFIMWRSKHFARRVRMEFRQSEDGQNGVLIVGAKRMTTTKKYGLTGNPGTAWVPFETKSFAYVYPDAPEVIGPAFVYLSGSDEILAVNEILNAASTPMLYEKAWVFKDKKKLNNEDRDKLSGQWHAITLDFMRNQGATHYTFVGPGEYLNDEQVEVGAFAYRFDGQEEERMNCYFELDMVESIENRANIKKPIQTAMLPLDAVGSDVQHKVTRTSGGSGCKGFLTSRRRHQEVPVQLARLKVPNVLHPIVLHSLMTATRRDVRETMAAKAIANAAYNRFRPYVRANLAKAFLNVVATFSVLVSVHTDDDTLALYSLAVVCLILLCNLFMQVMIFLGHRRWSWTYFTWKRVVLLLRMLAESACVIAILMMNIGSSDVVSELVVRSLLAIATGMSWVTMITHLSNLQMLGPRTIPVVYALGKVGNFILIISCWILAISQAGYALSMDTMPSILEKVYHLAFLQDFDFNVDTEEVFLPMWSGVPMELMSCFFILSSITLMPLMNIFIGVMTNAFDMYSDRAGELFVRHRTETALDWALIFQELRRFLCCCQCDAKEFLWYCHRDMQGMDDDAMSLRSVVHAAEASIMQKMDRRLSSVESAVRKLSGDIEVRNQARLIAHSGCRSFMGRTCSLDNAVGDAPALVQLCL